MPYDPARIVSDDPDFLEGLNSIVAVERDLNRTGGPTSETGGLAPNYKPDTRFTGLDSEPVRLVFRRASITERDARPGATAWGRALLGASIDLDLNNRLVWADPNGNRTRYLYVDGSSSNAHEMNHHWVCDFVEYTA